MVYRGRWCLFFWRRGIERGGGRRLDGRDVFDSEDECFVFYLLGVLFGVEG